MTHSGNFGNIFGNGVFDLWSQGLFVEKCLVEDEPGVDPLGIEPLGVEVNLGVNLGNDMKESAEDADDFADGDDMELELFDLDVGLLQTLVIGDKRCLKSGSGSKSGTAKGWWLTAESQSLCAESMSKLLFLEDLVLRFKDKDEKKSITLFLCIL